MLIWYNNSVLASIVSMLGCAGIIAAVSELMKGAAESELSVPAAIGIIVIGVLCVILGKVISVNKEKKTRAKAQQTNYAAAAAASPAANGGYAQPQYAPQAAPASVAPATVSLADEKPLKRTAITAGIFFLLAVLLDLWATSLYGRGAFEFRMNFIRALPLVMCILLAIASFRTAATREVCVLHVLGFIGLIFNSASIAMSSYNVHGFDSYIADQGIYHAMTLAPLLKAVAYLVLLLFAIFAMKKARQNVGGVVRALWIVPILVLALVFAKEVSDTNVVGIIEMMQTRNAFQLHPTLVDALSQLFVLLGAFFTGLTFSRISKKPVEAPVYAQPQYVAPAQPVQPQYTAPVQPVQPQYEPQPAAPVAPPQPAAETYAAPQADPQEMEKKLQACRDLLDCGILTQEEYEQEVRKIRG